MFDKMKLKIVNNLTKKVYEYQAFDIQDSRIFYHFSLRLTGEEEEGEYTYFLLDDDGKVLSQSMLQIGDYERENTVYTTENNGFKSYNG